MQDSIEPLPSQKERRAIAESRRLRIAVAMFGIPRCTEICAPSIEQNILDPLREMGEVSVHYHLYQITRIVNPRSGESGNLEPENYEYFKRYEGRLASPEEAFAGNAFDRWQTYGDAFGDEFRSLRNLRCQLWSLLQVTTSVEATSPDVVVFLRPDLLYETPLSEAIIRFVARHRNACVIPNWQWWYGYNDRFAVCSADSYWSYGARISQVASFCHASGQPLHPERMLRFAMRQARTKLRTMSLRAYRVRVGGTVRDESFDQDATISGSRRLLLEHRLAGWLSTREFGGAA